MSKPDKPSQSELKTKLNPLQYKVTQEEGTEPPFQNEYWDNHQDGIYVDVVSGEALFSSRDKFDSGTGWPSFTKPIESTEVVTKSDKRLLYQSRVEVRSKNADSHLGHVFDDGPGPDGKRYCINSAALRFIPVERLQAEGYSQYLGLFTKQEKADENTQNATSSTETAILAGGCFWGMQEILRKIPGVVATKVGYSGGSRKSPSYEQVTTGATGHAESIEIEFNPAQLSYKQLLEYFFRMHDPTTLNQQHNDIGSQYRSAIFYMNEQQKKVALEVIAAVNQSKKWPKPIVTEVTQATGFYPAEDYHQDYLQKHPDGYNCHYLR